MDALPISRRVQDMTAETRPVLQYITDPKWTGLLQDPQACDFVYGNPQEFPLPGITRALQKWAEPQNKDWFAYKMSEPRSQEIVAAALRKTHDMPFEPDQILMTTGAFAAISAVLATIIDPGDEIIYILPPWFFYASFIAYYNGVAVPVRCLPGSFDLDLQAIRQAITPRTRGIIINTPNNPTGRIYPRETLEQLASLLAQASHDNGRTIYLLSDESYNHIIYDGRQFPSPTAFYSHSFLLYTFGKTLLSPGQRMGYIALPPSMPDQELMRNGLTHALIAMGYAFPNALMQHALADLQELSIDIPHLQAKRDRLVQALREMGYELAVPEGTFYLLVRSPLEDDRAFMELLARHKVYCLPGTLFKLPGYFRISLTANDEMIDRAIPGFRQAFQAARQGVSSKIPGAAQSEGARRVS